MFYITNQDNQLIAADNEFLSLLGTGSLKELFHQLVCNEVKFDEVEIDSVEISMNSGTLKLRQNSYPLHTVMGDLHLYKVYAPEETEAPPLELNGELDNFLKGPEPEEENDFIKLDMESHAEETKKEKPAEELMIIPEEKEEEPETEIPQEETPLKAREENEFIKTEPEPQIHEPAESTEEGLINLLPDEESDFLKPKEEAFAPAEENIVIDTELNSKILGISKEDYTEFLNEFIDKAINEEETVKDASSPEHLKSITSLQKLSQMLHLDPLSGILETIADQSGTEETQTIELFYQALSNMTTLADESAVKANEPKEVNDENKICDLILDGVKPIHFDFQPKQASDDLGLPEDLIIEFINDFIDQAHENEKTFFTACQKGDIDTLHRTAHKLKGAASNLRIVPLAETLEELQFSEDTTRFESLIKKYWGQFLALEKLMSTLSNKKEGK